MVSSEGWEQSFGMRLVLTSASAVIAESITFPIDITKTRLQLQGESGSRHGGGTARGAFRTALGIVEDEGMGGLYKGLSPALLRHIFYTSIRIATYEQLRNGVQKHEGKRDISVTEKALIGGISGITGQIIASPADLIKVRMQADGCLVKQGGSPRYRGVSDAFSKVIQTEGITGLWRGVVPNAQRAFLVNMGELACYDHAKRFVINKGIAEDNVFAHTLASIMSGLCATTLSCPADVVKTRMMNQIASDALGMPYRNTFHCFLITAKKEGISALWKGFFPTWARLGPWQFMFWVSYEQMRQRIGLASF